MSCQEEQFTPVSKWGLNLLLLKTQRGCSVYNLKPKELPGLFQETQLRFLIYIVQKNQRSSLQAREQQRGKLQNMLGLKVGFLHISLDFPPSPVWKHSRKQSLYAAPPPTPICALLP